MKRADKAILMDIVARVKRTAPTHCLLACDWMASEVAREAAKRGLPAYRVTGEAEWNHPGEGWYHDLHEWVVIHYGDPKGAATSRNVFDPKLEVFRAEWKARGITFYRRYRGERAYAGGTL